MLVNRKQLLFATVLLLISVNVEIDIKMQ